MSVFESKIVVIGVGGAGSNAIASMADNNLPNVYAYAANTDMQHLERLRIPADRKIQLGQKGLGAGSDYKAGQEAAQESGTMAKIKNVLDGANLLFLIAGMGGGTGTGATHVIAGFAKEMKIPSIAIVTMPFDFEGRDRMQVANTGLNLLIRKVDAYLIISNQNASALLPNCSSKEVFDAISKKITDLVRSVCDIVYTNLDLNVDLADIKTLIERAGKIHIGYGDDETSNALVEATKKAALNEFTSSTIQYARKLLLIFRVGSGIQHVAIDNAAATVRDVAADGANIKIGLITDDSIDRDRAMVTMLASDFVIPQGAQQPVQGRPAQRGGQGYVPQSTDYADGTPRRIFK